MKVPQRASDRCTRNKVRSPGRPPVWQRENICRFWQAIASGRSSEGAAMDAGVSVPVGVRWFRTAGGMAPTRLAPSAKQTTERYLTFLEREEIAIELAKGTGIRAIARKLGRSPSTISRELRRNAVTRGGRLDYRGGTAQWHADRASRRPRLCKLVKNPLLRDYVQERLSGSITNPEGRGFSGPNVTRKGRRAVYRQGWRWATAWSPEQIANRLRLDFPEDPTMRISHEAIYQALYIQGRGALRRELSACLRSGRALRMPRERSRNRGKSFVSDEIRISERPRKSITFDNDTTFARHGLLKTMRDMSTWFCDAYASWQKGGIENANGRLRRWLPRHLDIDQVSDEEIQEIVLTMNLTPRKCLGLSHSIPCVPQ
jgi:IS30 family transposase